MSGLRVAIVAGESLRRCARCGADQRVARTRTDAPMFRPGRTGDARRGLRGARRCARTRRDGADRGPQAPAAAAAPALDAAGAAQRLETRCLHRCGRASIQPRSGEAFQGAGRCHGAVRQSAGVGLAAGARAYHCQTLRSGAVSAAVRTGFLSRPRGGCAVRGPSAGRPDCDAAGSRRGAIELGLAPDAR